MSARFKNRRRLRDRELTKSLTNQGIASTSYKCIHLVHACFHLQIPSLRTEYIILSSLHHSSSITGESDHICCVTIDTLLLISESVKSM